MRQALKEPCAAERGILSQVADTLSGMDTTLMTEDVIDIDDPVVECPLCGGIIDQLALTVDWAGFEPPSCSNCGAVLAA